MTRKKRRRPGNAKRAASGAAAFAARGNELAAAGRFADAARLFRKALRVEPGNFRVHGNLGNVLARLDRTDDAARCYARALEIEPRALPTLSNLALLKAESGDYETAAALYRRILEIAPGDAEARHDFALITKFTPGDPDLEAMERMRARPGLGPAAAMFLDFALAKACDDLGAYDRAFEHMAQANRAKRASFRYDVAGDERLVERIIGAFDETLFDANADAGLADARPLFIVGMPRSGTTLVEQILASHPNVVALGEVDHFRDAVLDVVGAPASPKRPGAGRGGFPERVRELDPGDFRRLGRAYVMRFGGAGRNAIRITDKMPRNFFFAGLIRLALPHARIVHCVRDPVDTCLSCFQIHFPSGQEFTYDLAELGRYYRVYARLMEHWRAAMPGRILDVRYEDLVAAPEPGMRRLLEFCGLEWDDACRDFHRSRRPVRTASAHQVRRPIYRTAVGRWRRYEKHLGPLLAALGPLADNG